MEQTPLSAADVAAVARNNSAFGGFGGFNAGYGMGMGYGAEWMWIVVLFALFGGGGFGWGNNRGMGSDMNGAFTRSDMQDGFNNQTIQNKIDALGGQISTVNSGLCDGFYETTKNLLQGQNQLNRDLCQGFSAVSAQVAENRYAQQNCCCETKQAIAQVNYDTNRNIDASRYESAKNTCEIVRAIEKSGDETRKLIVANQLQDLRDKVAMQSQVILSQNNTISQFKQNEYLVDKISPCPKPTYSVYPPFPTAVNGVYGLNGLNGYNNSCGCGCGNY